MTLMIETQTIDEGFTARVTETLRSVTKMSGAVVPVEPGNLVNDGKVIEDKRDVTA